MQKIINIKIISGISEEYMDNDCMRGRYGFNSDISIEAKILNMLKCGWQMRGDPICGGNHRWFSQTMVKYEEEKSEVSLGIRRKTNDVD